MTYLMHVTLTTGHRAKIPATKISDAARRAVQHLADLEPGKADLVPTGEDLYFKPVVNAGVLVADITDGGGTPLVTMGVARKSRPGAKLWRELTTIPDMAVAVDSTQPPAPWLATLIWPQANLRLDNMPWIADFQHAVAWAWIERKHDAVTQS